MVSNVPNVTNTIILELTIKRSGIAEPISGNIYTREIPVYCDSCKIGKLGQRVYKEEELIGGTILPYDHDQWLQCYHCGAIIPKYDIPQQGQLTTDIEPIKSKFSINQESEHYEPPKHRRGFNERLPKEDDGIRDPDVKQALKKGQKLISYSEK